MCSSRQRRLLLSRYVARREPRTRRCRRRGPLTRVRGIRLRSVEFFTRDNRVNVHSFANVVQRYAPRRSVGRFRLDVRVARRGSPEQPARTARESTKTIDLSMGVSYSVKKQTVWIDASRNEACVPAAAERRRAVVSERRARGGIEAQLATIRLSCPTSVVSRRPPAARSRSRPRRRSKCPWASLAPPLSIQLGQERRRWRSDS